jgi:hypothetical protein
MISDSNNEANMVDNKKILLVLLPYWTPQIPPVGLACLKSYLEPRGYEVTTVDVNVEEQFRDVYGSYFDTLRETLSEARRGNFYNIGHDVLQNHLMAHLNVDDEAAYTALVKELIYKTFFYRADDELALKLSGVLTEFYARLQAYMLELLEREQPGVLGLSVFKGTLPASAFTFKLTRETYPGIKTVMGGAVFSQTLGVGTPNFHRFLEYTKDYLDALIVGEGELLFHKWLRGELPAGRRVFTLEDTGRTMLDLDTVSPPDFLGLNLDFYPNMAAYTSRSCPFQCSFCTETVYWGKYRKKSAKQIVEELTALYQAHGSQLYLMCDSLLNPVVTDLAREFTQTDICLYWDGYLRVDHHVCDPEKVQLWRQGGFYRARLGVESGSRKILDAMHKHIPIDQVKTAIRNLADAGIKTTTYWIIGYPGETEEDFQATLDLIEELKDDIYEADCNPFGYYLTGQVDSDEWSGESEPVLLYPENATDMLVVQSYVLDAEPTREETYRRLGRFIKHCHGLGIANPYSLYDIHKADERWKKLHPKAVPGLIHFKNKDNYIDESKHIKKLTAIPNTLEDDKGFGF